MHGHHPGPPRVCTVGETVDLAPRDPDPTATYRWSLVDAPADSACSLPDAPVVTLLPDRPGTYRCRLDAPDGSHPVTVRAFPDPREVVTLSLPARALPRGHDPDAVSVVGHFNEFVVGRDRPERVGGAAGDEYVFETHLPPGDHGFGMLVGDDMASAAWDDVTVPGPGRPRVRLDAETGADEVVVTATAHAGTDDDLPTVEFLLDDRDGLTRADVTIDGAELRVPADAVTGPTHVHAVAVGARPSVLATVRLGPTPYGVAVSRPGDPPAWVRDAVVYEVFVRGFAGSDGRAFERIADRLDYLADLGVDCLWLTPVLDGPTDHGYEITDYFDTAADLGSRDEFEALVEQCHDAGIRVLFDLVVNHTGEGHPAFRGWQAGVPDYDDWYVATGDGYEHYFDWGPLPNLNYDSLAVRRFVLDVVDEWAPRVDGFRCDIAWGVPHGFWQEVRERVKARDGDFCLLDETVPRDPRAAENAFDLHHDTALYHALRDVGRGEANASALLDAVEAAAAEGFPDAAAHLRYVENHDETRYAAACGAPALRAAVGATLTLPGTPMLYYGQERGMTAQRGAMTWDEGEALLAFHRDLVGLRRTHRALRRGTVERIDHGGPPGTVAYAREADGERLVVVLNVERRPTTVVLGERFTESLFGGTPRPWREGTRVRVDSVTVLK